ncbi:hypothetical protein K8352_15710 [Flavobacteriaceae bacterium F89]|uniref:GP-PDE domain-containing protein n=1 Tax=Cerina litoralis TaxID=2874477 RepID=A0AAE3EYQ0_9FLAO|nr:glycerophosphodiester phosphodiesterase family protein [Cerina litoralis]MCG2462206.1 hypothetical protein [Cerina litoralis]
MRDKHLGILRISAMRQMGKYIFLSLCAFLLGQPVLNAQSEVPVLPTKGICAHRGAVEHFPENTIPAFEEAIRLGAQMIEFDVQLTKDNKLVVIHDRTLDRTTNGVGPVNGSTLAEIIKLDAGSWKSDKFSGEKVPTLQEVLRIMPKNVWLNIHLKGNRRLGVEVAQVVVSENRIPQSVIACERKAAQGVQNVSTEIAICNMERLNSRTDYIDETIKKGYAFIQLKKSRNNGAFRSDIERLKKQGIHINYVQADTGVEMAELFDLGVNFILTDHLTELMDAFGEKETLDVRQ